MTRGEGTRIEDPSHQDRAGRGHTSLNPISSQRLTVFFIYYLLLHVTVSALSQVHTRPLQALRGVQDEDEPARCVDLLAPRYLAGALRRCLASALRAYVRVAPARSARTIISVPMLIATKSSFLQLGYGSPPPWTGVGWDRPAAEGVSQMSMEDERFVVVAEQLGSRTQRQVISHRGGAALRWEEVIAFWRTDAAFALFFTAVLVS